MSEGVFFVCFPANQPLEVEVNQMGFRPYQNSFTIPFWENQSFYPVEILLETGIKAIQVTSTGKDSLENSGLRPIKVIEPPKIFTTTLFYGVNEYQLTNKHKNELDRFIQSVAPNRITKLEIIGFADYVGSDSDNVKLSEERARQVTSFIKDKDVKVDQVYMDGHGEVGDEQSADESRRVEVIIHAVPSPKN
ncbi:MAG: OmpA family protein [Saprospiraceae bacterium]|nr:OmpA family protein [Saprospiraceae bacterium]